mmetsp:Transcript_8264/g.18121  ORF Transcript_8264/g.18121 Transcript_8264/m.18121 type:complete len:222 (-) Transcript_8264:77-742(-)
MAEPSRRFGGEVALWNARFGWGFIRRDDGDKDIFVHQQSISASTRSFRSLLEGERVEFEEMRSDADGQGQESRLEAVQVTGPGGKPVIGQVEGALPAHAPYHACHTIDPVSASGGQAVESTTLRTQSHSNPARARPKPYTALVPRSLSRSAAALRGPARRGKLDAAGMQEPVASHAAGAVVTMARGGWAVPGGGEASTPATPATCAAPSGAVFSKSQDAGH